MGRASVASGGGFIAFNGDKQKHTVAAQPAAPGPVPAKPSAANAALDLFDAEPRLRQVADIAAALEQGLAPCRDMPGVRQVRVKGAIGVVELERIANLDGLRARFVQEGVFVRPFGTTVYLTPAFTISPDELATLTSAVVKVAGEL